MIEHSQYFSSATTTDGTTRGENVYIWSFYFSKSEIFSRHNLSLNVFLTVCASFCINFRGHRANNHVIFIMLYEKKSSTANMLPKHYPLDHTKITRCSVVYSKNRLSFVFVYANEVRQTSVHILWLTRDTNFEASSGCSRYCQCNKRFWGFDFWALSVL